MSGLNINWINNNYEVDTYGCSAGCDLHYKDGWYFSWCGNVGQSRNKSKKFKTVKELFKWAYDSQIVWGAQEGDILHSQLHYLFTGEKAKKTCNSWFENIDKFMSLGENEKMKYFHLKERVD